jgi:hypothetical protein
MSDRQSSTKDALLRRLQASKMGIEPGLLRHAAPRIAGQYESQWAPVEHLAGYLAQLPVGMLRFLADHPRGYLLVSGESGYVAGAEDAQERQRTPVARFSLDDLESSLVCLTGIGRLLDHLLGCHGAPDGRWLSEGGGVTQELAQMGAEIGQLFHLGYGIDDESRQSPRSYLARSLAWSIEDRRALNVADPRIERLLTRTLLSEPFWKRVPTT